jgi:predicted PurR-regulated permease PerM
MTAALLLTFVVPLIYAIASLVNHMDVITGWVRHVQERALDTPPDWIARVPGVGARLDEAWRANAATGELGEALSTNAVAIGSWFVGRIGHIGGVVVHLLLTVVISAILYMRGEAAGRGAVHFARAIGGQQGENAIILAAKAIRGVALGVGLTAVAQALASAVGLWAAGVPYVGLLTAVILLLALAQIGAVPVLLCATVWLFVQGSTGWGIFLLAWTVIVGCLDNVLRPLLIKRGVDLPLLLILIGVIGGLMSFGLLGIFIGPAVLAVTHQLLVSWTLAASSSAVPAEVPRVAE